IRARYAEQERKSGRERVQRLTDEERAARQAARALDDMRRQGVADLERQIAAIDRADEQFAQLAATLSGPLAAAEYQHQQNLREIDRLGKEAGRTSAEIAHLKRLEADAYAEAVEKIKEDASGMTTVAE